MRDEETLYALELENERLRLSLAGADDRAAKMERRYRAQLRRGDELETALASRRAKIKELNVRASELYRACPTEAERRILDMWPRYEDTGDPVPFGGEVDGLRGRVTFMEFHDKGCNVYSTDGRETDHIHIGLGERVKHPAVIAADGAPYVEGETVYHVDNGEARTVTGTKGEYVVLDGCTEFPLDYTHVKPEPPDSWERIERDAVKQCDSYWGCEDVDCDDCPAMVDGKNPWKRYGAMCSCDCAMRLDIVRRCKALSERSE